MSSHAANLRVEGSLYISIIIFAILYGIYIAAYFISTYALVICTDISRFRRIFYLLYGTILLLLNTLFFVSPPLLGQRMWTADGKKYSGGPLEYFNLQQYSAGYTMLGNAAQNVAIVLVDGLLVYRCYIIFNSKPWIVIPLALCMTGSLAVSMATIPIYLGLNTSLGDTINAVAIMLTITVNVVTPTMIAVRILIVLRRVHKSIGIHYKMKWSNWPINIAAILVESALPNAVLGIISCVMILAQSDLWHAATIIWSGYLALFPQLIILRIAQGIAWTGTTSNEITCWSNAIAVQVVLLSDINIHEKETAQQHDRSSITENHVMDEERLIRTH